WAFATPHASGPRNAGVAAGHAHSRPRLADKRAAYTHGLLILQGGPISAAMLARFVKMHGCGNDFVVFDERAAPLGLTPSRVAALADRRTGIGCDQLIMIEPPPEGSDVAAFMRIRNPDGGEAGACGNATRCVADLLARETGRPRLAIRTV